MKKKNNETEASSSSSESEEEEPEYDENGEPKAKIAPLDEEVDRFLVMGLSKGSVIFVRVKQIEHIYARFNVHKQ